MIDDITPLRKLADGAARVILETLDEYGDRARETVKMGAYGLPSSLVDVTSENFIIEEVQNKDLPYSIFTEEAGFIDRGYEKTLVVDPLDGSYNAEHGVPYYAVSIAVVKGNLSHVEMGVVRNVPSGDEYWASVGKGAYKNGTRIEVDGNRSLYAIYLGTKAHPSSFEIAKKVRRVRSIGSAALEMCMVAEGTADAFIYNFKKGGVLRIVDIAAAYLIVREAGGMVLDGNLEPLNMKISVEDRKNVIAVATEELLEVFR